MRVQFPLQPNVGSSQLYHMETSNPCTMNMNKNERNIIQNDRQDKHVRNNQNRYLHTTPGNLPRAQQMGKADKKKRQEINQAI